MMFGVHGGEEVGGGLVPGKFLSERSGIEPDVPDLRPGYPALLFDQTTADTASIVLEYFEIGGLAVLRLEIEVAAK